MSIVDRPYAGTWSPNKRSIVQYTPDALVYLNGDTSLPGCRTCHHDIDIQQFVTSISVDCGVEPGASTSTISLSIPKFYGDSLFRDGNTLLKAGLEVHLYGRGYFPMTGMATPNKKIGGVDLGDIPQHPYYPMFHGVVTSVSHEYSGGYHSASLTCNGMLHFWSHMKISTNGSFFGARPQNSRVQTTLTGHPYTGRTPYAIIYDLYRDTTGAAAGVGFALQSRTNFSATSSVTRDSTFSLAMRYWERRFRDRMYGLRMHGASGQMFTTSQQSYLSQYRTSSQAGQFIAANLNQRASGRDPFALDQGLLLGLADRQDGRILRQPDLSLLPSANGGRYGLNVTQMQAFVRDIGAIGQVNLFESTYESKLDVATQVSQVTGFEFYQDVDGDLVFKPPLYNLDTSSSRVYRLEPIDIISIGFNEAEPEATYIIVKAGPFQNTRGLVDEAEWGVRSVYVDYKLVAQFGWREQSIETQYYNNARSAFFAGVAQLDRLNAGVNSCTITIPFRPEIRPGFPVYIPHIDCYYYTQSISHAISFGSGQPQTTLNLVARRRKFFPPGAPSVSGGRHGVASIDLANTALPPKPLQTITTEGVPRLLGFPNVVMALDPTRINPQFFAYGFQIEDSVLSTGTAERQQQNRSLFLDNFIQVLVSNGLLSLGPSSGTSANPMQGPWTIQRDGFSDIVLTKAQLTNALGNYIRLRNQSRDAIRTIEERDVQLQRETLTLQNAPNRTPAQDRRLNVEIPQERARGAHNLEVLRANFRAPADSASTLADIQTQVRDTTQAVTTSHTPHGVNLSTEDQGQVAIFTYLINQARPQTPGPGAADTTRDPTGTINESANILDLLNDRKASMSVNTPGYYRYYSASHPDPAQQGYAPLDTQLEVGGGEGDTTDDTESQGSAPIQSGGSEPLGTNTPVTGARLRPGPGVPHDAPRLESNVREVATPMEGPQVVAYLREAWRHSHGGQDPSDEVLAVLAAQWAHENGQHGRGMYNFNFGGIKAQGAANNTGWQGASVYLMTTEDHNPTRVYRNFRAYGSARQGAQDYLGVLMRVHGEAVARVVQSNDPAQYVQALHDSHYMTGTDATGYIRSVTSLTRTALREWIPASRNINTSDATATPSTVGPSTTPRDTRRVPERSDSHRVPTPGGNSPGRNTSTVGIRREDLESVVVTDANDVNGVSVDAQQDLVSLTVGIPTNGVKVRTSLSRTPLVVPTSQIFTLSFEERSVDRASTVPTIRFVDGVTTDTVRQTFEGCLVSPPLGESLGRVFADKVGQSALSNVGQTGGDLVTLAMTGITNLRDASGSPITSTNIANGTPSNRATLWGLDVTTVRVGTIQSALRILQEKASDLIVEVTVANQAAMERVNATARNTNGGNTQSGALEPLAYWTTSLATLFGGTGVPPSLPFHSSYDTQRIASSVSSFSPIFPVSDERGYEHYGSYQYGRGLSIEPGGNYERLMATDPFRYVDPVLVDAFTRQLRRTPVSRDSNGNFTLDTALRQRLTEIAGDQGFQNSVGGQVALQWGENTSTGSQDDRVTMIANGLANYILSDRDSVTKLPVSNAAFSLTDLQPQGREELCGCRGAEADLLLGAYMAGAESFVTVDGLDSAVAWVTQQRLQAAAGWSQAQQAMRGVAVGQGRRSLLDQVSGWEKLVDQGTGAVSGAAGQTGDAVTNGLDRLNRLASRL